MEQSHHAGPGGPTPSSQVRDSLCLVEAMVVSSAHYPQPNLILTDISMLTCIVHTPLISKNNLRQLIVN